MLRNSIVQFLNVPQANTSTANTLYNYHLQAYKEYTQSRSQQQNGHDFLFQARSQNSEKRLLASPYLSF